MGEVSRFEESKLKLEEAKLALEESKLKLEEAKAQFDEYKLFVEDTQRFSERRARLASTYVTINSLILGVISLLLRETSFAISWEAIVILPLLLAGIVACMSWSQSIRNYRHLVAFRIDKLREMEELPEMAGRSKMYHAEDVLYPIGSPRIGLNLADTERMLPWVLGGIYGIAFVGIAVSALF
jgi:hypothetical protein